MHSSAKAAPLHVIWAAYAYFIVTSASLDDIPMIMISI